MKDIIRYAYYVTSAFNIYEVNESSNLALRYSMFNELPKFLFKENILFTEIDFFTYKILS